MALLQIYTFPDAILKQQAKEVEVFDESLKKLSEDMFETMYDSKGIGLAAVQVAVLKRILVMDIFSGSENLEARTPKVLINPKIIEQKGEIITEEGCLSVVDFTAEVKRFQQIQVQFQNLQGAQVTQEFIDLEAICVQHEMDHLQGILFIDHLSAFKRKLVKKKLAKQAKKNA